MIRVPSWLWLSVSAVLLWGVWGVQSKVVSAEGAWRIGPYLNHVLSTAGIFCVLPLLLLKRRSERARGPVRGAGAALLSGVLGGAGNVLLYRAFDLGGLASVVLPLSGLYPLVTLLLAVTLLGERLGWAQLLGLPISLASICLLSLDPKAGGFAFSEGMLREAWLALALGSLVLWGLSGTLQKVATSFLPPVPTLVAFAFGYLVTALFLLLREDLGLWELPNEVKLLGLAGGVMNGLGVLCLLAALARGGKASVVVPLTALYPVVTLVLAMAFLDESPGSLQKLGALGAVAGGMLLAVEKWDPGLTPRDSR